ncbi:transcriptional regulator [Actinomadura sp. NBRC 104412]|uniref:IclR family transcriptional regulator n=1 Tax=Actinomadura sp. NBRC 104412 TaxID=3032203 RepID=UPI0024A28E89|nr:helix-turn-helix domain-containing protein [Actinomadura sp. NBRC 104412]GLZ02601.1 transcriptional regulator [Actinomadura sp. NBRC 104412]
MSTDRQSGAGGAANGGALTLDRGLRVLELLAAEDRDFAVAEIASELSMHRQAVYRLLNTLTAHHLAARTDSGRYCLGLGVLRLSHLANSQLRRLVLPQLRRLAESLESTAQCVVAEGNEAVALSVVEPENAAFHLSQHPGARHPLEQGASGIAILSSRPPTPGEPQEVTKARELGYVVTSGQLTAGAVGIATPLRDRTGQPLNASIGIVSLRELDIEEAAAAVMAAAANISEFGA